LDRQNSTTCAGLIPQVIDRCEEILKKYPDFSGTDRVLYLIGETYRKSSKPEQGATYYAQIVRDYPTSDLVNDSKKHLVELKVPVPDPNPLAVERAKQRAAEGKGLLGLGLFKGGGAAVSTDTKAASVKNPVGALSIEAQP
jgi:hypothetical protein